MTISLVGMWTQVIPAAPGRRSHLFETVEPVSQPSTLSTSTLLCPQQTVVVPPESKGCPRPYQQDTKENSYLLLDGVGQLLDLIEDVSLSLHQLLDLVVGMHDRGVITATELLTDSRKREIREFA